MFSALMRFFLVLMLTSTTLYLFPQMCFHKKNQFDVDGKKDGYWVSHSKLNPEIQTFRGWYKHGNEAKKCTYYNNSGTKMMRIKYLNDSLMRIRRYNQNGKIEYKGYALWLTKNDELRFCWDGEFTFYDSGRRVTKKVMYIRGEEQD
jgi:antitoxin component YwqK of YwqJK toxin-antitoxin module